MTGGDGLAAATEAASVGAASPRRVLAVVLVALAAAALAALVAPSPWPRGEATLVVAVTGEEPVELAAAIGSGDPVTGAGAGIAVEAPLGLPNDGMIEVDVRVAGDVAPRLEDVTVELVLADGATEAVPVVRIEDDGTVVAERRPPQQAAVVLGLLAFVAVLWVTGAMPLHLPSLLVPVVLGVAGVATATEALAPFFHPIIALFFAGFLMAIAMQRVGLDHWVATQVVARASSGPWRLYLATLGLSAFLSMWMSNTAAVAVLIPVALAIARPIGSPSYQRALVLGLAYAATVGGVGSAIGTPANPLAIDFLDEVAGRSVSFVGWFAFGLPMVVLLVPTIAVWVWWRGRVEVDPDLFSAAREVATAERARAGRLDRHQVTVLVVFVGVVVAWLTQTWHHVDTGLIALAGALVLALLGRIDTEDLGRISWSSLLTFGGGLTLGLHLTSSGVADWVATRMVGLASLPATVGVLAVAGVVLVMTTLASNTATAAVMVPLAIPLAGILSVDPIVLVVVVAIASSIDFALVIGTPPTMLAHATGLFTTGEIFARGVALDLLGVALLVLVVVPVWGWLGVV